MTPSPTVYRPLGATGLQVSALGFGSMRLPMTDIGNQEFVDLDRAVDLIRYALDAGVNYIDCGFQYGNMQSEIAVGRALRGRRDQVIVTGKATKTRMFNPGDMRSMLDSALSRMSNMMSEYTAEVIVPDALPEAMGFGQGVEEAWANYLSNAMKI